jgi:hypothetical protein
LQCEGAGSIDSSGKGQRNSSVAWQYKRKESVAAKIRGILVKGLYASDLITSRETYYVLNIYIFIFKKLTYFQIAQPYGLFPISLLSSNVRKERAKILNIL